MVSHSPNVAHFKQAAIMVFIPAPIVPLGANILLSSNAPESLAPICVSCTLSNFEDFEQIILDLFCKPQTWLYGWM